MATHTQGDQRSAGAIKYTRFLGVDASGTIADLCTDLSQYDSDFDDETSFLQSLADTRFTELYRTWRIRFGVSSTDSGYIGVYDPNRSTGAGAYGEGLQVLSGQLRVFYAGSGSGGWSNVFSVNIPNLSGSERIYRVFWSTRPNPNTTGASDVIEHWLWLYDETAAEYYKWTFATYTGNPTLDTDNMLSFGSYGGPSGGSSTYTGNVYLCAYDECPNDWPMPLALWREIHVGAAAAPSTSVKTPKQPPYLRPSRNTWGAAGEFYGPQALVTARHHHNTLRRTWSPLLNKRHLSPTTMRTSTWESANTAVQVPGTTGWYAPLCFMYHRPVPELADRLSLRLHLRSYVTSGSAVPVGIRVYSSDRPPGVGALSEAYYHEVVVERDDSSGVGSYDVDLDDMIPIARDETGMGTYLWLAFKIDPNAESSNDGNWRGEVNYFGAFPRTAEDDADGFGGGSFGA